VAGKTGPLLGPAFNEFQVTFALGSRLIDLAALARQTAMNDEERHKERFSDPVERFDAAD